MGSDAVYTMFGQNTRELEWFVKAGMTPAQALATRDDVFRPRCWCHGRDLGAIAPGYFADIVAVEGDPLADITAVVNRVPLGDERWCGGGRSSRAGRAGKAGPAGQADYPSRPAR
jgi:imidazolonepropionase-like amidohydrolase